MTDDLSYLDFDPEFRCEISDHDPSTGEHDEDGGAMTLMLHCPTCGLVMSRIVCETYGVNMYVNGLLNGAAIAFACPACKIESTLTEYRLEVKRL